MSQMKGFTLLEVLLALAIFAVSALTLANSLGVTISSTARMQQQQLALWVADNQLVDLQLMPSSLLREGDSEMGGLSWHWQLDRDNNDDMIAQQLRIGTNGRLPYGLWSYVLPEESVSCEKK